MQIAAMSMSLSEMRSYMPCIPNIRMYTMNPARRRATNTDAHLNLYSMNTASDPVPMPNATDKARTGSSTSSSNGSSHIASMIAAATAATSWHTAAPSMTTMNLEFTRSLREMPEDSAYLPQPVFSSVSADTAATAVPMNAAKKNGTYGPDRTIIE